MKPALYNQLHQIYMQGSGGVDAGNLIDKCATRELIRMGLVDNTGGPPSSIDRVYINRTGSIEYVTLTKGIRHAQ